MKQLHVYDDIHKQVKTEAARTERTTTNTTCSLLRHALWLLKNGKISLDKLDAAEKRRNSKKEATK